MDLDRGLLQDWLEAAKAGDDDAFAHILKACYPSLFRLVYQIVPSSADVEEILQDAFFRFYRALRRVRPGEDPFPYLRTIAVRRAYTFLKRRPPESVPLDELPPDLPALAVRDQTVDVRHLYAWAATLPAKRRLVFLLREVLGLDDGEVAGLLGLSRTTVRRHASLAREDLEKAFGAG